LGYSGERNNSLYTNSAATHCSVLVSVKLALFLYLLFSCDAADQRGSGPRYSWGF